MLQQSSLQIKLTAKEREELERRSRARELAYRGVVRARIILKLTAGQSLGSIGKELKMGRRHVRKWGQRFVRKRLAGLEDEPKSGRPPLFSP